MDVTVASTTGRGAGDRAVPPGWRANPSAWAERLPMPWVVMVFGVSVGPLGATSVLLVIAQPVLYHSWCTLCLASAVISVAMIGPAVDEVLASLQHLRRVRRAGGSLWRAFWRVG